MVWQAKFWYRFPNCRTYMVVNLDPTIRLFIQKADEHITDDQGRKWFKPDMDGEPDFVWKEESIEARGRGLPFEPSPG